MSLQKQLVSIQEQVTFLYQISGNVIEENNKLKSSIGEISNRINIFTEDLIELYFDSETKRESINNEKEN
jgi:hypothetical protein